MLMHICDKQCEIMPKKSDSVFLQWGCAENAKKKTQKLQSGASSLAKHGGAYFSAVCGSIQDPIAAPGPYGNQEP